jgi:dTDP-4-dehydrorhamnose 3,5-epimerase
MIDGVVIKQLVTHSDERGFFRELIRATDDFFSVGFGQLSHSLVHSNVVKAWHYHHQQTQWNYPATGLLHVVLYDRRADSSTCGACMEFLCGGEKPASIYCFPSEVLHGYRVLSGPVHMFYVTSGTYDPDEEGRLPMDDSVVGYDWSDASIPS